MDRFRYLIDLFDSINVSEKGIEKVYNYLLIHKKIDDPKLIQQELDINSFQRVYKIIKVLKDLDLVQTYGRPMKAILNAPVETWQKIISQKIEEIQHEASERINNCEEALAHMIDVYKLAKEAPDLPPVEFVNISTGEDPFDFLSRDLISSHQTIRLAKDLHFKFPFLNNFYAKTQKSGKILSREQYSIFLERIMEDLVGKKIQILFSEEYIKDMLPIIRNLEKQFDQKMIQEVEAQLQENCEFQVWVHPSAVGNFIIKNSSELLQYSIHPSNYLLGFFISRQDEIINIFKNKFDEKCSESKNINELLKVKSRKSSIFTAFLFFIL